MATAAAAAASMWECGNWYRFRQTVCLAVGCTTVYLWDAVGWLECGKQVVEGQLVRAAVVTVIRRTGDTVRGFQLVPV